MIQPFVPTAYAVERAATTSHVVLELATSTASIKKCRTTRSLFVLVRLNELGIRRVLTFSVGIKDGFVKGSISSHD